MVPQPHDTSTPQAPLPRPTKEVSPRTTSWLDPNLTGLIELRTGAVAAGGGCVAHAPDGRVVFVRHCLPGELVLARVTAETSSYLRADAVEILERSAERVSPPCEYAGPGRCGGCDWQHIAVPAQRQLKANLVSEQLRRLAKIDPEIVVEELPGAPDGVGWRTRIRFATDRSGRIGLRRHRSHDIQLLDNCLIASPALEALGIEQARWPGASEVEAFAPQNLHEGESGAEAAQGVVVVVPGREGVHPAKLPKLPGSRVGVVVEERVVREPQNLRIDVLGHSFRVSAGAFWQIHRNAPAVLGAALMEALEPNLGERVIDLFAGVGLFSVLLGAAVGQGGEVISVERQRKACADARHNARGLPQIKVWAQRIDPDLIPELGPADLVVLDPPREGAGRALTAALVSMRPAPRKIAYIACDASSFARDLRVALDAGWQIASLRVFDLFPMTEHVELLCVLEPGI